MAIDPALLAGRRVKAWAMVYANDGLPVFLLRPGEKVPMISRRDGGRGFYDATTDADQIAAWCARYPHANIAIRTGAESGLLVSDVDPRNGGSLEELYARFPELRQTRTAQSANGGWHLYLRYPGFAVASGQNVLGPGIDVKCDKGYIVAHPS